LPSRLVALAALVGLAAAGAAGAKVYQSREEAIASAFPDVERVETRSVLLDDAQARRVEELAGGRLETRLVTIHSGLREGRPIGHALIDVHSVRTLPEALLVVLTPEGTVRSLRVIAFHEPEEYLPRERWLAQFEGRALGPDLRLRGAIDGIAGATLSSQAVTLAVRRALAIHQVLLAAPAGAAAEGAAP
jgi:Na+-translocating ferredoxin:NAD+ oxidoreductase RnfG subunit